MFHFSNIVRTKGDPTIIEGGPSLKRPVDQFARALGWFSVGLGVVELLAPRRVTETLGMEDLFAKPAVVILEWSERFPLPSPWPDVRIRLEHLGGDSRRITVL